MLSECMELNELILLNGRSPGDNTEAYTFEGPMGSSVIDLVWCSYNGLPVLRDFKVCPIVTLSDHYPVLVYFTSQKRHMLTKKSKNINFKLNFDKSKSSLFYTNMSNMVESQEIWKELDILNEIITATRSKVTSGLGMRHNISVNKKRRNKVWFDGECVKARKLVDSALKVYKQSNFTDYTRLFYLKMKSNYKNIIKLKKKAFQTNSIQVLANARNSTDFWSTISGFRSKGFYLDVISIDLWHRYLVDICTLM